MSEYEVESKLGKVWMWPTGWGLIVDASSNGRRINVNGVEYATALRLKDYGEGLEPERGKYPHETYYALSMSRKDWRSSSVGANEASPAARKKAMAVLIPLAREWAASHPLEMVKARVEAANLTLETIRRELIEARRKVADLEEREQEVILSLEAADAERDLVAGQVYR